LPCWVRSNRPGTRARWRTTTGRGGCPSRSLRFGCLSYQTTRLEPGSSVSNRPGPPACWPPSRLARSRVRRRSLNRYGSPWKRLDELLASVRAVLCVHLRDRDRCRERTDNLTTDVLEQDEPAAKRYLALWKRAIPSIRSRRSRLRAST
jgi:hypothetical protein